MIASARGADAPSAISLSGTDWRIREDAHGTGAEERLYAADPNSTGWVPATVPGNIQLDLEAAHLLKPLWYGIGDPQLYDVARKDWWYRKDFTIPASFAGKRLTLVFDGVDFQCEVWLNDKQLGAQAGMFRRFGFDVTEAVRPGEVNRVAVRISRMPESLAPLLERTDGTGVGSFFVEGLNKTCKALKELKSPTNWAYDWGVNIWTLGIWKDVRLEVTGPARIDWTRVRTELSDDHAQAKVLVSLEVDSAADLPCTARFRVTGPGREAEVCVDAFLEKGSNSIETELPIERPALWWPSGQGEQPLYTVTAELEDGAGGIMDARHTRFGVRDIRWVHTEGAATDHISRYQLIINGRPVRTLGSNLIPADLLFGRMTLRALQLLRQAKAAGMNTLRLWGGGVILHESVYDLADELGIMLIQEFPLANTRLDPDPVFLANLEATVRNIVRQVRNHPAIIEFDGGNEMPWNSASDHPALLVMRRIVAEDDGRLFRATCPDLGATHSPWYFDLRRCGTWGDTQVTMRAGEFGSSSPANLEVWHREIPLANQMPLPRTENPVLTRKNVVDAVFSRDYWLRKSSLENVFGALKELPELVEAGQFHGAEALRSTIDGLRRQGRRVGGFNTWDLNEPWPNGAGSYLIDYDGRPLMNYDFVKQALAPLSLSLKYSSVFYSVEQGIRAELFLTSDAPQAAEGLHWKWLARDRRGHVFANDEGVAAIAPLDVKALGNLTLKPPPTTAFGPVLVELRLEDAGGTLLAERLHMFGPGQFHAPFARLVKYDDSDPDDDPDNYGAMDKRPTPINLMSWVKPEGLTPAAARAPRNGYVAAALNDGAFGEEHAWSDRGFKVKFKDVTKLGRFKFGRDRTGGCTDRCVEYLKIETSLDGDSWQTVFEANRLTSLPGFDPSKTVEIEIPPAEAALLKVTVVPPDSEGQIPYPVIDEFEAYGPPKIATANLPRISVLSTPVARPLRPTRVQVEAQPMRIEGGQEVLEIVVTNTGPMTAFPCEIHPLISYRTDLFIDNNHCFVPPGESRTITIRADRKSACGLSLSQTGWWLSCWNAAQVTLPPGGDVLLAVGRCDKMCREFAGYFDSAAVADAGATTLSGTRPNPSGLPYLLASGQTARFEFPAGDAAAKHGARLRLHTADQAKEVRAEVVVKVNGKTFEQTLPDGLGIQQADPAHLAYPASAEFVLPAGTLQPGNNVVEFQLKNAGWFTWDSLECVEEK